MDTQCRNLEILPLSGALRGENAHVHASHGSIEKSATAPARAFVHTAVHHVRLPIPEGDYQVPFQPPFSGNPGCMESGDFLLFTRYLSY